MVVVWVFLGACASLPQPEAAAPEDPMLVISWDGAADWVLDRLRAEGALPNVEALAGEGVVADHSVASFPSKTAASHATLWTGCWPSVHGVVGNRTPVLPLAEHTLLESAHGFSSRALQAEPLFLTAALAGRRVAVLSATQQMPSDPYLEALQGAGRPPENFLSFSGFDDSLVPGRMLTAEAWGPADPSWTEIVEPLGISLEGARGLALEMAETTLEVLAFDDRADPVEGLDTLLLRDAAGRTQRLKPRPAGEGLEAWSTPLVVRSGERWGHTYFRLFDLDPGGERLALYQRAVSFLRGSGEERWVAGYRAAYSAFHDNPFHLYEQGGFGLPLMWGGDGTAEERALELVRIDLDLQLRGAEFIFRQWHPDLVFHYSPLGDSAGHTWVGWMDPAREDFDEALAARLWDAYRRVFQELDRWLGEMRRLAPPRTTVALVSDHGMQGVWRWISINRLLAEAGLVGLDSEGRIDLATTKILLPAYGDFFLRVNDESQAGGWVPAEERQAVLAQAREALLAARDPQTGEPLFATVWEASDVEAVGGGGPSGGDLYLDPAPGYYPSRRLAPTIVESPASGPRGEHGFWPLRRSVNAIFYAAGPGLKQGHELTPMRHIDVAPTLARLLGIPAPAQSCGRVLEDALAAKRR